MKQFCIVLLIGAFLLACGKRPLIMPTSPVDSIDSVCDHGQLIFGDTSSFITFATAFTPNGDGRDDLFRILRKNITPINYSLSINGQKQQELFYTEDPSKVWDGTLDGVLQPAGPYLVRLRFDAWGKTIDTCTYLYLCKYSGDCIGLSEADKNRCVFEDQFDLNTGTVPYPTSERFCQ